MAGRWTGRCRSVRPPFMTELQHEYAFSYLLVKHGYLLAMGIDTDVWIWKMKEQEDMEDDRGPDLTIQFRLKGHNSTVPHHDRVPGWACQPAVVQCGSTIIHQGQLLGPLGSPSMSMTSTWTPRTSSPPTRWSTSSRSSQLLTILFRMGL